MDGWDRFGIATMIISIVFAVALAVGWVYICYHLIWLSKATWLATKGTKIICLIGASLAGGIGILFDAIVAFFAYDCSNSGKEIAILSIVFGGVVPGILCCIINAHDVGGASTSTSYTGTGYTGGYTSGGTSGGYTSGGTTRRGYTGAGAKPGRPKYNRDTDTRIVRRETGSSNGGGTVRKPAKVKRLSKPGKPGSN